MPRTLEIWEQILSEQPTDALALRLAHYKYFWTGRREEMRRSVERAAPKWSESLPLYGIPLVLVGAWRRRRGA